MHSQATSTFDPEAAWQQVLARDTQADGQFVYAVETTGIFCRPSCPSNRPAQRHVRFFLDAPAATEAGYRACRRCHPAGVHAEAETVASFCAFLRDNLDRMVTLRELGLRTGQSPFTIQRMFERVLGISPRQYQIELRAQHLREGLRGGKGVTEAVYDAGYASSSRAYEGAQGKLGMQPRAFRRKGFGESISYTVAPCALGTVIVAATERGVCHIGMGDDAAVLEADLRTRFAEARLTRSEEPVLLRHALAAIASAMTTNPASLDLPLDLRATAFQQRVWQALRNIPRGETRTYSELATLLGHPRAVRAVAQACAKNPVAPLIPCHRVIGSNGSLTGYRWGTERKRKLLELERAQAATNPGNRGNTLE